MSLFLLLKTSYNKLIFSPLRMNVSFNNAILVREPGGSTISDIAKKMRAEFNKTNDKFQKLFTIDDYVRVLPTGTSKVIEKN